MEIGRISGLYGVRGWVKVYSHTEPKENLLAYAPWLLRKGGEWREIQVLEGAIRGKGIIARLEGIEDRDEARRLMDTEIFIRRSQLPHPGEGEYYWADLIGLRVITAADIDLGRVEELMETGSNDVLVVKGERERLIPFILGQVVIDVDREQGVMRVDWDPEF